MPAVVRIDPHQPQIGLLSPFYAQRVRAFAEKYQPEVNPTEFTAAVMSRLWLNDPKMLALGIVEDDTAKLVGHALASHEGFGSEQWVTITQVRADENVGDARIQVVNAVVDWAKRLGVKRVILHTNRDGKDWQTKLGFKSYRHVLRLTIDPESKAA
jgi:hypothetical protein